MNTKAPPKRLVAVMIAFALSCVGLLMFLWLSFGGSLPLAPQGYRFTVEFSQAVNLGSQADVEIAGVTIGKVVSVGLDRRTGLNRAVIEIDSRYAPRPANTRAILRQKTLLGETFVQLTLGNEKGPMLRDGGMPPAGTGVADRPARPDPLDLRSGDDATRSSRGSNRRESRSPGAARPSTPPSPSCSRSRRTSTACSPC